MHLWRGSHNTKNKMTYPGKGDDVRLENFTGQTLRKLGRVICRLGRVVLRLRHLTWLVRYEPIQSRFVGRAPSSRVVIYPIIDHVRSLLPQVRCPILRSGNCLKFEKPSMSAVHYKVILPKLQAFNPFLATKHPLLLSHL